MVFLRPLGSSTGNKTVSRSHKESHPARWKAATEKAQSRPAGSAEAGQVRPGPLMRWPSPFGASLLGPSPFGASLLRPSPGWPLPLGPSPGWPLPLWTPGGLPALNPAEGGGKGEVEPAGGKGKAEKASPPVPRLPIDPPLPPRRQSRHGGSSSLFSSGPPGMVQVLSVPELPKKEWGRVVAPPGSPMTRRPRPPTPHNLPPDKKGVAEWLIPRGYEVTPIQEDPSRRTPDFSVKSVRNPTRTYRVEVKTVNPRGTSGTLSGRIANSARKAKGQVKPGEFVIVDARQVPATKGMATEALESLRNNEALRGVTIMVLGRGFLERMTVPPANYFGIRTPAAQW